jgi:hypothetical protein
MYLVFEYDGRTNEAVPVIMKKIFTMSSPSKNTYSSSAKKAGFRRGQSQEIKAGVLPRKNLILLYRSS